MLHQFGEFEIDEESFELREGGAPVPIQAKVLDLLIYLVQHRGRLVTKEELHRTLWRNVTVSDASLARAVMGARRALHDESAHPRWVTTVRGRGYRFAIDGVDSYEQRGTPYSSRREKTDDCQPRANLVMRSS